MSLRRLLLMSVFSAGMAASAPVAAQAIPEFYTTGSWVVTPVTFEGVQKSAPGCVMVNQYDNGFLVRIIGGYERFVSMTVDFRQDAFVEGNIYPAFLRFHDGSEGRAEATAHGTNVLVFAPDDPEGFYESASRSQSMDIVIGGNPLRFSLRNFADGMNRLESCVQPPERQEKPEEVANFNPVTITPGDDTKTRLDTDLVKEEFKEDLKQEELAIIKAEGRYDAGAAKMAVEDQRGFNDGLKPQAKMGVAGVNSTESYLETEKLLLTKSQKEKQDHWKALRALNDIEETDVPEPPDSDTWNAVKIGEVSEAASAPDPLDEQDVEGPTSIKPGQKGAIWDREPVLESTVASVIGAQGAGAKPSDAPVSSSQELTKRKQTIWTAKAGDDIKIVLARWAERADVDLVWRSNKDGKLANDIEINGSFADAVRVVMTENADRMGVQASFKAGEHDLPITAANPAPAVEVLSANLPDPSTIWYAEAGDDLRKTIARWAEDSRMHVVWNTNRTFKVKNNLTNSESPEKALQLLLEQYNGELLRPIGTLNIDPESSSKTLFMSSSDVPQS